MSPDRFREIASYWCDVFEKYSVNTPIDRLLPEYRVANDDITAKFPDYSILNKAELWPHIRREMKRRKLTFKKRG